MEKLLEASLTLKTSSQNLAAIFLGKFRSKTVRGISVKLPKAVEAKAEAVSCRAKIKKMLKRICFSIVLNPFL